MTMASVGQKLIAFVYFLFLARVMMPERTGVFFLVTSIITMFSVFTDLGVTSILIRETAKSPENQKEIIQRAVGLKILLTVFSVVLVFCASFFFQYDAQVTRFIWLTMFVMVSDALTLLCYGILRGAQKLRYEATGMFLNQLSTVGFGVVSLLISPNVFYLILALILGSVLNLLYAIRCVALNFGWRILIPSWNRKELVFLLKTMIPFALAGIFTKIYSSIDVLLISKLMDATSIGIYSVAYKFTYAFQFLPLALAAGLYPSLSATVESNKDATTRTMMRSIWYLLLIVIPIVFGIWLIAPEMVGLVGDGYTESVSILRILIFVLIPSFLEVVFGAFLNASNKQASRMKIMGIAMLINGGVNLALIPVFGLMGAVIGSFTSFFFMILLELVLISRALPNLLSAPFFRMLAGLLASGGVMLVCGIFLKPYLHWMILIPCLALVYFATLLATKSLQASDLNVLRSLFKKSASVV